MTKIANKADRKAPRAGFIELGVASVQTKGSPAGQTPDGTNPQNKAPMGLHED